MFVQFLLLTIIESTTIMFPLLASTSLFTAMVMVSLCCHLLEIAKKFLTVNERDDMDKSTQLKLIAKDYLLSGFSVDVIIALAFFLQLLCDWDYVGNPTALLLMLKIHSLL